jgi:purine-binding chemotaxis protein CheW
MRLKYGMESAEYNDFTVVIVLNVAKRIVGIVVDSVSDVVALAAEQIKQAPEFNDSIDASYITGIGSVQDRMMILIDIEALIGSADMGLVANS